MNGVPGQPPEGYCRLNLKIVRKGSVGTMPAGLRLLIVRSFVIYLNRKFILLRRILLFSPYDKACLDLMLHQFEILLYCFIIKHCANKAQNYAPIWSDLHWLTADRGSGKQTIGERCWCAWLKLFHCVVTKILYHKLNWKLKFWFSTFTRN